MTGIEIETQTLIGVTLSSALLHHAELTNGEQHTPLDLSAPASLTLHFSDADSLAGAALVLQNAADALRRTIASNAALPVAALMDPAIVPPTV